jgi:transcriptional regulator with XRE-family HTH domain
LGLFQKEMAATIGVDTTTIHNWENNRTTPPVRFIPRIINLVGYEPSGLEPPTLSETIKRYRFLKGINQEELARKIGIDPGTLSRLERNRGQRLPSVMRKVAAFVKELPDT